MRLFKCLRRHRFRFYLVVMLVFMVLFLVYRAFFLYVYRIYPLIGYSYVYGALLIDEEKANKILGRIGLSIDDIVIMGDTVYYLVPLHPIGYYYNGTLCSFGSLCSEFIRGFHREYEYRIVLVPNWSRLLILIGSDELELTRLITKPLPLIIDPTTNTTYDLHRRVIYPDNVFTISNTIAYIVIEVGSRRQTNTSIQRQAVENVIREYIEREYSWIVGNSSKSITDYIGPRIPGKLIYINDWPVYFRPIHDVCDDHIFLKKCFTMYSESFTRYGNVSIRIQSLSSDQDVIDQMKIFLNRIMGLEPIS